MVAHDGSRSGGGETNELLHGLKKHKFRDVVLERAKYKLYSYLSSEEVANQ